jgi:tripartite-type tricarboxylate transporter receptor subunit TctC
MKHILKSLLALCLLLGATASYSNTDTLQVIVPFSPGGGYTTVAKHFEEFLIRKKKLNLVVNYKPGADGVVGTIEMSNPSKVNPSTTIGLTGLTTLASMATTHPTINFEYVMVTHAPTMFYVSSNKANIKSLGELEYVLTNSKEQLKFGYGAISQKVLMEQLVEKMKNAKQPLYVPYKGAGQGIIDLIGGHIDFMVVPGAVAKAQIDSNLIQLAATDYKTKYYQNKDVISIKYKDWKPLSNTGAILPKDTSPEMVRFWRNIFNEFMTDEISIKNMESDMYFFVKPQEDDKNFRGEVLRIKNIIAN